MSPPLPTAEQSSIDHVELLREASEASSLAEQGYRLLRRMRSMFGAEVFMNFLEEPDRPGWYRVCSVVDLPEGELDPATVIPGGRWGLADEPALHKAPLLDEFARHQRPATLDLSGERRLPTVLGDRQLPEHAVVLPIYRGGRATEWARCV